MNRSILMYATWSFLAGAGIPFIGVLSGGMSRAIGNPFGATAVTFVVAFLVALGFAVSVYGVGGFARLGTAPLMSYGAGLLVAFYVLSATVVIPRFGAGNFIAFILLAQLATAAAIDQFGLLGMARSPIGAVKAAGLLLIIGGIVLMQLATKPPSPL